MILHNYLSNSGRDLIYNTLIVFRKLKKLMVIPYCSIWKKENLIKFFLKDGKRKCMRYIFRKITVYSILQ